MKKVSLIFFLLFFLVKVYGQQCLITEAGPSYNMVYSSRSLNVLSGNTMYNNSGSSYSSCGWSAVTITGNSCSICTGVLPACVAGVCTCILGTIYSGYEANSFSVIDCPLDSYSSVLVLIAGISTFIVIRNKLSVMI